MPYRGDEFGAKGRFDPTRTYRILRSADGLRHASQRKGRLRLLNAHVDDTYSTDAEIREWAIGHVTDLTFNDPDLLATVRANVRLSTADPLCSTVVS